MLPGHEMRVHPHQGKGALPTDLTARPNPKERGLLDQLPAKLQAFAASTTEEDKAVLVLVDADRDDCIELARRIRDAAKALVPELPVLVRIAVEETEAFYLGDLKALKAAYPDADMAAARAYRPDSICGTWEKFGEIVGDDSGNKVAWAEALGPRLTTTLAGSRSPSFRALCSGLRRIVERPTPKRRRRRYHHVAKKNKAKRRR